MSRYRPHRSLGRRAVIRLLHYWAKRQFNDEKRCKYQERIDALLVALLLALSVRDDFSAIPFQTVKSPPAPIELSGGGWQRFPEGVKLTASASQQATTLTRHFKAYASHLRIDTLQRLIEVMTCSPKTDPPENGMSGTIGEPSPEVSMKGKKHTEEQIAFALNQAETGVSVGEICRKMGIAESCICWLIRHPPLELSGTPRWSYPAALHSANELQPL